MEAIVYIDGKRYTVPSSITAKQWATIAILPDDKRWFISAVLDIQTKELFDLEEIDIEQIYMVTQIVLKDLEQYEPSHIKFDEMTFGQWVDLDVLASDEPHTKIVEITSKLLKQDTSERALKDVWPHFRDYLEWRNEVYQQYKNLFGLDGDYAPSEEQINITDVWYDAIMVLADSQFIEIDNVVEKPFRQALNFLSWKKDQAEKQKETLKNIQSK